MKGFMGDIQLKKIFTFWMVMLLTISLCACSSTGAESGTTTTIEKSGVRYVVDKEAKTISDGTNTYQYDFAGDKSDYELAITYPDASNYWFVQEGSSGHGGWSDDYDENKYVDGDILREVIVTSVSTVSNISLFTGEFWMGLLLLGVGIFNVAAPSAAWYLEYGWRFKDAEPSDIALVLNRIVGVVIIVIVIVFAIT